MNKVFHQTAPLLALQFMQKEFQDFLITDTYTIENLQTDADLPDMVDHDNITMNAEIHHAHSYKLQEVDGQIKYKDGDVLERLKGLCADVHDFKAEGKEDLVRYCLGKMTHYRVDSLTAPHTHSSKPFSEYHAIFETELGKFINKHTKEIKAMDIKEFNITPYSNIYKDCRKTAIEVFYEGKDIVQKYENKIPLTDEEKMKITIRCIKGILDLWTTLAKELKII